jgi:hypothetical protein
VVDDRAQEGGLDAGSACPAEQVAPPRRQPVPGRGPDVGRDGDR